MWEKFEIFQSTQDGRIEGFCLIPKQWCKFDLCGHNTFKILSLRDICGDLASLIPMKSMNVSHWKKIFNTCFSHYYVLSYGIALLLLLFTPHKTHKFFMHHFLKHQLLNIFMVFLIYLYQLSTQKHLFRNTTGNYNNIDVYLYTVP